MIIHSASVAVVAGVPALAEEPVAPVQESLIFFLGTNLEGGEL